MMKKQFFTFQAPEPQAAGKPQANFDEFEATELYCADCGRAVPVRKFLLLVLPEGEKYEYRCQYCGGTVGDKIDRGRPLEGVLKI
ncbi:MAG: cytoplasmic protein [Desulfatiglandales bacterium]